MKLHFNVHFNPDIEAGRVKMWGLKCKLKCGHHILTPPAGLSLPQLASAGLGWPQLASAGLGWPQLASARLAPRCPGQAPEASSWNTTQPPEPHSVPAWNTMRFRVIVLCSRRPPLLGRTYLIRVHRRVSQKTSQTASQTRPRRAPRRTPPAAPKPGPEEAREDTKKTPKRSP